MSGTVHLTKQDKGLLRAAGILRLAGFIDAAKHLENHVYGAHLPDPFGEVRPDDWDKVFKDLFARPKPSSHAAATPARGEVSIRSDQPTA